MTFFNYMDSMKKNPSIKITRELWTAPGYYIYWSATKNVFCEHFADVDREWSVADYIEDLTASDWKEVM